MPVPDAMPDDGVLDVLAVGEISRLTFFRLVGKYAQGLYRQYPQLITDWHGQSLSFSSPREITVVVDGEVMRGTRFTCGCRLFPRILALFSPLCERTVNFYEIARNFLKLGVDFLF